MDYHFATENWLTNFQACNFNLFNRLVRRVDDCVSFGPFAISSLSLSLARDLSILSLVSSGRKINAITLNQMHFRFNRWAEQNTVEATIQKKKKKYNP